MYKASLNSLWEKTPSGNRSRNVQKIGNDENLFWTYSKWKIGIYESL